MSVEVTVYVKRKEKEFKSTTKEVAKELTFDNLDERCIALDYFGGSWVLFNAMRDAGFDADGINVLTPEYGDKVTRYLTTRVEKFTNSLSEYEKCRNMLFTMSDVELFLETIREVKEELEDYTDALNYWKQLCAYGENLVDIVFTCSY